MKKHRYQAAAAILLLIGVFVRFYDISGQNLWLDEAYSANIANLSIKAIVNEFAGNVFPPLYYILLSIWTDLFGTSVFVLRSLSAIAGSISLLLFSLLLPRGMDYSQKIFAILIFSLSPTLIYFSQEVRMYSFLIPSVIIAYYVFDRLRRDKKIGIALKILYLFSVVIAAYVQLTFLLFWVVLFLFGVYVFRSEKNSLRLWLYMNITGALFFLPWGYFVIGNLHSGLAGQQWRSGMSFLEQLLQLYLFFDSLLLGLKMHTEAVLQRIILPVHYPQFLSVIISIFYLLIFSASAFIIGVLLYLGWKNKHSKEVFSLFLLLLTFAMIALFVYGNYLELQRYLVFIYPLLIVVAAYGLHKIADTWKTVLFLISFLLLLTGDYHYFESGHRDSDHTVVIASIIEEGSKGSKIVLAPEYMQHVYSYYQPDLKVDMGIKEKEQPLRLCQEIKSDSNIIFIADYRYAYFDSLENILSESGDIEVQEIKYYSFDGKVRIKKICMSILPVEREVN